MEIMMLPTLNACLNSCAAILLVAGYIFIKKEKAVVPHMICMLAATLMSTLFLISYLYYHYHHGSQKFMGTGWIRLVYFTILITHTILAAVQTPMIITTLVFAFRNKIEKHKQLAKITFPIWLYVSITGVVIYWMLYQL